MGKKLIIGLAASGLLVLLTGLLLLFIYPILYNKESSLVKGSEAYDTWKKPDFPIYMKYHMFTYTNVDDIMDNKIANVTEIGVLSYKEISEKKNIEYVDSEEKVRYISDKSYVYDEDTSTLSEDFNITVPNIALFTVYNTAGTFEKFFLKPKLNGFYNDASNPDLQNAASVFYQVEAGDFLWGYNNNSLMVEISKLIGGPTTFGLQFNNTDDGLYEIYTGEGNDNKKRGLIYQWNNSTTLHYWNEEYPSCNEINGTDGTVYPANVPRDERLYIFNTQICRSIFVLAENDETIKGVDTTKFSAPPQVFEVDFEDNIGFCGETCLGNGLLDVSGCYSEQLSQTFGQDLKISVVISSPHYLYCDNSTIDSVIGMNPVKELHETFLNLELESGVPLKASKRLQVSTVLNHLDLDAMGSALPSNWQYMLPLFWAEEVLPVDDDLIDLVDDSAKLSTAMEVLSYIFIAIGIILLIAAVLLIVFSDKKKREEERTPLIHSSN